LAVTPKALADSSPSRDMIAALSRVPAADVSFLPPEPAGLKLARTVLSPDTGERKKAVTALAALPDTQPEAVAFLADAFSKAPADVKIDIIAALGLLAPKTPQAVQPLIVALNDKPSQTEAMAALGSLGASAAEAVPALKKIALNKRASKPTRAAANVAISRITGRPLPGATHAKKKTRKHRR
jgi:hypothetical protein